MKNKRKRIWIDRFQTFLVLRISSYFILYQATTWALTAINQSLRTVLGPTFGEGGVNYFSFLVILTLVFLGIMLLYDLVKLAHRVVGPVYRFRKTIRAITAGEELDLITLRKDDYLMDMQDEFNEMLKVLEQRGAIVLKNSVTASPRQEVVAAPRVGCLTLDKL
jgi:hypothetical protein